MKKLLIILALIVTPVFAFAGTIQRVSVSSEGVEGNQNSPDEWERIIISADGRYVVFSSFASNLVPDDTNNSNDIFVYDRVEGTIERVSVDSDGIEGNSNSIKPSVSADGRYVAFQSSATNLVAGDTNAKDDIFVHDRTTGATERVSVITGGGEGNNSAYQVYISGDGRYVSFGSFATNLVENDTNAAPDVFVHDRELGTTERISVDSDGVQGNGSSYGGPISEGGRYVAFVSDATNLVAGDTNAKDDIFVHDRTTGATERVSVTSEGGQANSFSYGEISISADGRYVAFVSDADNLITPDPNGDQDIYVYDRTLGEISRVSVGTGGVEANNGSYDPASISGDGRYVTFYSYASNLVEGDTNNKPDVFVHDRETGVTERVSVNNDGVEGNDESNQPNLSYDGRFVVFASKATNLVDGDTNIKTDVFLYDRNPDGYITITKTVVNDDGGSAVVGDFTFYADDEEIPHDTETAIRPGTYTVTEDGPAGYTAIFGGDCAEDGEVTVVSGESVTCTIENNDDAPAPEPEEESSGGGGSSRKKTVTPAPAVPSAPLSNEEAVKSVLEQLILVLQQLIQAFLAQQQQ